MFDSYSLDLNISQLISTAFVLSVIYWFYKFWRNETIFLDLEKKIFNKNNLETNCDDIEKKYPNTWYPIIQSRDLKPGELKPIYVLENDLVVYRSFSGKAYVLDAYCPHQGAHLGVGGSVVGEDIRCPFHSWTFSGSGVCTSVPGLESQSLPKAKVKTWKCIERNHLVFIWFHNRGLEPDWTPEQYEELEQAQYCGDIQVTSFCHIKDVHGNGFDKEHLDSLHTLAGIVSANQLLTKGKVYKFINRFLRFNWVYENQEIKENEYMFNKIKTNVLSITPVLFNIPINFLKSISTIKVCLPMVHMSLEMPSIKAKHYHTVAFYPISYLNWPTYFIFYYKKYDILSRIYAKFSLRYLAANIYPEYIILANMKHLDNPHLTSLDKKQAKYYRWADRFYD